MTNRPHVNFGMTTVRTNVGPKPYPCEHTPSERLVIAAFAVDAQGRPAFGGWTIVVVPHQLALPLPEPHCHDIETTRWVAHELATTGIDWTAPTDVLTPTIRPLLRDLIRQCDESDAAATPPGTLPASTLRQICEANTHADTRTATACLAKRATATTTPRMPYPPSIIQTPAPAGHALMPRGQAVITLPRDQLRHTIAVRFACETAEHEMTILHDDGLYRHVRFANPRHSCYWFDLITVPGALIFQGDGDSFVFRCVEDMYAFFRASAWQGTPNIGYWAEKVCGGQLATYEQGLLEACVTDAVAEYHEGGEIPAGLLDAVQSDVLDELVGDETVDRRIVASFEFFINDCHPDLIRILSSAISRSGSVRITTGGSCGRVTRSCGVSVGTTLRGLPPCPATYRTRRHERRGVSVGHASAGLVVLRRPAPQLRQLPHLRHQLARAPARPTRRDHRPTRAVGTGGGIVRPPVPYYGGKQTIGPHIAGLLPPHGHYVEPYAGSLAVLLAKARSRMETANDLDGHLVAFWRTLRDRPAELARACALTPHSREEWQDCADLDAAEDLERARRLWVRLTQSRTSRLTRTGWRHYVDPGATNTAFPKYLDGLVQRMAAAAERLHHVTLECRPALEIIDRYGAHADVLLYVDPPYLGSTRSNDRSYRIELMDTAGHRELAEALRSCPAAVVLSGYPSDLYDAELYPDWNRHEIVTGTGQGPNGWSNRVEVLWSNRPLGQQPALWEQHHALPCAQQPACRPGRPDRAVEKGNPR
jgi:DNA adenine methylase